QCSINSKVVGLRSFLCSPGQSKEERYTSARLGNPIWINVKKSMSRYQYSIPISQ
ncbi:hypothetical protein WUBG_11191, partial [Wuchereria bancrofti]